MTSGGFRSHNSSKLEEKAQNDPIFQLNLEDFYEGAEDLRIELLGTKSNDVITGLGFSEKLVGLEGDDYFRSGKGSNTIQTGAGGDTIVYTSIEQSKPENQDKITDFNGAKGDRIDLSALADSQFTYIGNNGFSGKQPEVRFEDGLLQVNINEDQTAEMEIELEGVDEFEPAYLTEDTDARLNNNSSNLLSSSGVSTSTEITVPFVTQDGAPTDSFAVISAETGPYVNGTAKLGKCPGGFPYKDCFQPSTWTASLGAGFSWGTSIKVQTGSQLPTSGEKFKLPIKSFSPFQAGGGAGLTLYIEGGLSLDGELKFDETMKNKEFTIYSGQKLGVEAKFGPNYKTNFSSSSGAPRATVDINPSAGLAFKGSIIPRAGINGGVGVGIAIGWPFNCEIKGTVASLGGNLNSGNNILFTIDSQSSEFASSLSGDWSAFGASFCGYSFDAISGKLGQLDLSSLTINPIETI